MNKIRLNVDMLAVESFDTQAAIRPLGTVRAYQDTFYGDCSYAPGGCFYSQDGGITCGCESEGCTGNRLDKRCYDSMHYCEETNLRPCSTTESGNTDC